MKSEIIAFLRERNIEIPDDDNELTNLFLGALVVDKIDYWLERSFDYIENSKSKISFDEDPDTPTTEDEAYRSAFAPLDDVIKAQLKKLLQESVKGVISSILSELDKDWTVNLDSDDLKGTANGRKDLYDDLQRWIDLFSQSKESKDFVCSLCRTQFLDEVKRKICYLCPAFPFV